jgi:hypothetical protein
MEPELTRGLLESVEYAADAMTEFADVLRRSHKGESGWDSEEIHQQHKDLMTHCFRLECFGKALGASLRQKVESN